MCSLKVSMVIEDYTKISDRDCVWILNKSYKKTNIKGLKDWRQWKARADSVKNTERGLVNLIPLSNPIL